MRRNFKVEVKDTTGRPYVRQVFKFDDKGMPVLETDAAGKQVHVFSHFEPMTLTQYAIDALEGRWRGDEDMNAKQAVERIKLRDRIALSSGECEISREEANMLIKALERQGVAPAVLAAMSNLIETDPQPPASGTGEGGQE